MEYRILGKTGLHISRMGLGGIPIQRIDAEGTKKLMHQLMEAGVNFVDSARGYSVSEEYLGYALEGIRDKFVLATKSMARTKEEMARDVDISLKNFRTDYIDLYQFHNPNEAQLHQLLGEGGAMEALQEAKAAGKIGHIGITLHSAKLFERVLEYDWVESIMFPYNFVETHGKELIARAKEKNIGIIDMKPLAGGALENANLAVRFVAADPNVDVIIPGMADAAEVEMNLAAVEQGGPFTAEEEAEMERTRQKLGQQFCRRCNYCAPCTVDINISNMFIFQGYLERYGLGDWAKGRYFGQSARASDCIGCGVCEQRCPYNLPIREMLKKAAEQFEG